MAKTIKTLNSTHEIRAATTCDVIKPTLGLAIPTKDYIFCKHELRQGIIECWQTNAERGDAYRRDGRSRLDQT